LIRCAQGMAIGILQAQASLAGIRYQVSGFRTRIKEKGERKKEKGYCKELTSCGIGIRGTLARLPGPGLPMTENRI
jgi:hypothetical protein